MTTLGLPTERVEDWQDKALATFDRLLAKNRALKVFMDSCVRCGACTDKCHYYLGTGDPNNMPVARAELLRELYRRVYTPAGRLAQRLRGGPPLDEGMLEQWNIYFWQCSQCRRCSVYCPYGIDTAEITWAAREIMASIGVAPKYTTEVIAKVYTVGNNLGIPPAAWKDSAEFLEDEMYEETGVKVELPVDREGVDVLLIPPSADMFANPDTAIGYAKIFHAAGISWTTSTYASEGGNFGLFLDHRDLKKVNKRMVDAARQLNVRKMVMGECGHAWRAAQAFTCTVSGPLDFLEAPRPQHILELTLELIRKGALDLVKSRNDDIVATYHDPCNVARAGGLVNEPREVLKAVVNNFIEMPRDCIREYTFCCGGGGGMLADEIMELRMAGGKPRADAVRITGANTLVTPCAICKAQLPHVMKHWELPVEVSGVVDLVARAMRLPGQKFAEEKSDE